MARQEGIFNFRGKLGNVVGVKTKNGYFVRSLPDVPPEERASSPAYEPCRKSSGRFGENSTFGTYVRHTLADYLELMADGGLNNRLLSMISAAREWCMKDNPNAPLDFRKIAPGLKRFSLRKGLCLNDIAIFKHAWVKGEDENTPVLHIPKFKPDGRRWRQINVEIVRWHVVLIPLPHTADQTIAHPNEFLVSDWMPVEKVDPIQIPVSRPMTPHGPAPLLIAAGFEPAQGTEDQYFPLRTLCVMEILEII